MQDVIERSITINAPKEKVYEAIANQSKITEWFPDAIEGEYKVGEQPLFVFGDEHKTRVLVTDAQPHEYFAYRWVPGANSFEGDITETKTTKVEFRIKELNDVCTVTVTETGFSELPAEIAEASYKQNSEGWSFMIGRLEDTFKN